MTELSNDVFALSPDVRYVAHADGQHVETRCRADLQNASSGKSDRYEELLVNPTLLTLATRRGDIDCGGLRHLVVGYGHFNQLVVPLRSGHISIAFELATDPAPHVPALREVLREHGLIDADGGAG